MTYNLKQAFKNVSKSSGNNPLSRDSCMDGVFIGLSEPLPTFMSIWWTGIRSLCMYGDFPVNISTTVAATLLHVWVSNVYYSLVARNVMSYHISDSVHAFSCLSTSGAAHGIVPYIFDVFDVPSMCSYIFNSTTLIVALSFARKLDPTWRTSFAHPKSANLMQVRVLSIRMLPPLMSLWRTTGSCWWR